MENVVTAVNDLQQALTGGVGKTGPCGLLSEIADVLTNPDNVSVLSMILYNTMRIAEALERMSPPPVEGAEVYDDYGSY